MPRTKTQAEKVGALHEIPASFRAGPHWFAVRTNIRCERRAQMGMDALGYRTYLPQCIRWVTHARIREKVRRTLFPRYVFVEFDINLEGTDGVRTTDGVESILGAGGVPITIPGEFITDILGRELAGEFDEIKDDKLASGTRVAIIEGKYDGLIAILTGVKNNQIVCRLPGNPQNIKLQLASVRAA